MNKKVLLLLVLSTLTGATVLSDGAAATLPGKFRSITTLNAYNCFHAGTLNEPLFPYSNSGLWDSVSERMLYIGAAHQVPLQFIGYVETANDWRVYPMPAGFTGVSHPYDQETLDSAGILYYIHWAGSAMYRFNTRTNRWLDGTISGASGSFGTLDYFPEKNGLFRAVSGTLQFFNIGTQTWQGLGSYSMGPMHNLAQYSHAGKCVYFGGGDDNRSLYKIDTAFRVTTLRQTPFAFGITTCHLTADPVTGTLIVMTPDSLYAYDAAADTWGAICKNPISTISIGYSAVIPISTYGVIAVLNASSWPVLLFKYADPVSVERNSLPAQENLMVSQNPVHAGSRVIISSSCPGKATLFNMNGKRAASFDLDNGKAVWNVSGFPAGVYFLKTIPGNSKKIVILP